MTAPATPRSANWHETATAADNTEVVLERATAGTGRSHQLTSFDVSFDSTATAIAELFGLTKVGPLDLSSTSVLNLTTDIFSATGHGLAEDEKVVFHTLGGTAPTGLTSGNTYYVIRTDANSFQLESTLGGGAINMSGTQANFGTEALIIPLSKSWTVYDHLEIDYSSPLRGAEKSPLIFKIAAVLSVQGRVNASGYSL